MIGLPGILLSVGGTVLNLRQSPGQIIGGTVFNTDTQDGYLVFFDKLAADVTLGTTVPIFFVGTFGQSTSPLCRAGEGVLFQNAISVAGVSTITGNTERVMDISYVIQ